MIHCRRECNPERGCSVLLCPMFFALCLLIFLWTASFSLARLFSPCSKKTGTQEITHSHCLFLILIGQAGKAEDMKFCRVAAETVSSVRQPRSHPFYLIPAVSRPSSGRQGERKGLKGHGCDIASISVDLLKTCCVPVSGQLRTKVKWKRLKLPASGHACLCKLLLKLFMLQMT